MTSPFPYPGTVCDEPGIPAVGEAATQALDDAMAEIFDRMLAEQCDAAPRPPAHSVLVRATIRIACDPQGVCIVELSEAAADQLAHRLLGGDSRRHDGIVEDTVGEFCNMLAGGVKRRLTLWPTHCSISLPKVQRAPGISSRPGEAVLLHTVRRWYRFADTAVGATLELFRTA